MREKIKKLRTTCSIIILATFLFNFLEVSQVVSSKTVTLAAVTSVRAVSYSYNSTYISWKSVTGASGYKVYRATSSKGTYKYIATTKSKTYKNTGLTTGKTYYYKIRAYKTSGKTKIYGKYSSKVSAKPIPSPPTLVKASKASYNSINISWGGVSGANEYKLYRATSSKGSYKLIKTTKTKSYKNTGLNTGTTYYYKVKAYRNVGRSKVYSNYSSVVSSKPSLSTPTSVKAAVSSYNSVTVSWGGVSGANGYKLYRATSSKGSYALISTTTSKSYKNTGLTTGTSYYYKVKAYRNVDSSKVYSSYSSVVSSKPSLSTPTSVKATVSSYNSVTVSWGEVTGASGYEIYRTSSSSGTYTLVSTTTSKSYSDIGLSTGTSYYYKVRAYVDTENSKVYSSYSSVINTKPALPVPSVEASVSASHDDIDLSWNAISEVNGYEVYRASSSSGTYTLISDTSSTSYSDIGLTAGTTYYYKVRAYINTGDNKLYSSYSTVVSRTVSAINVTAVSLNKSTDTLVLGRTDTLTASITPTNATNQSVKWKSSNSTVVKVDSKGKLTTVSKGTATITVTTVDGNMTATCKITVSNANIKGIDVSKWQGTIKWSSVKSAGIKFAMIRSSYGSSSVDPMFSTNYAGAKANGIAVGAYHYSYANTVSKATTEVNSFIKQLKGKQFEYPVCVDMEDPSLSSLSKTTLTNIVLVYLNKLSEAGYYPMIYANKTWFTSKLDDSKLKSYDHWLAQWASSITYTGAVGIWQYSDAGSVSGISGKVDMDIAYVDYATKIKSLHLNGF
ncbi:GH25 family lysozyme [Clostridium oryzae]|uniref:Exoglucanase B n=1 Tax=Clostridium oryzae TaxID=1450648 RepID=A0A1V4IKG8_9CLOT|nr:GH25 family lysozyme [Clostridium oryzae]OPJ60225.1 exoglucanase B precursor [Clostridium oryzae]